MKEKFNKVLNDISNIVGRKKSFNYKLKNGTFNIYWGILSQCSFKTLCLSE